MGIIGGGGSIFIFIGGAGVVIAIVDVERVAVVVVSIENSSGKASKESEMKCCHCVI